MGFEPAIEYNNFIIPINSVVHFTVAFCQIILLNEYEGIKIFIN